MINYEKKKSTLIKIIRKKKNPQEREREREYLQSFEGKIWIEWNK